MHDLIPFTLDNEKSKIKTEIKDKYLSLIFDGTSRLGEVLAVVFRYIGDNWQICQCLVRLEFLGKSLTGEEVARELISILSVQYGIESKYLLGAMWDGTSVNNVAIQVVNIVYPEALDIDVFRIPLIDRKEIFYTSSQ